MTPEGFTDEEWRIALRAVWMAPDDQLAADVLHDIERAIEQKRYPDTMSDLTDDLTDELLPLVTDVYYEMLDIQAQWGDDVLWRKYHAQWVDRWLDKVEAMFPDLPGRER